MVHPMNSHVFSEESVETVVRIGPDIAQEVSDGEGVVVGEVGAIHDVNRWLTAS